MIFHYLDKIVDYRLKQDNKKIKLEKAIKDVKKVLVKKIRPIKKAQRSFDLDKFINKDNYKTIYLSRKYIQDIKNKHPKIIVEYALAKQLSENGYSPYEQSIITNKLRENLVI